MTATRLTRKEQQARTRSQLLQAAGRVFADHGMHRASVEQVAAEAGYTKGAFYANFASKEAIFLALLEESFAERIAAIDVELTRPGSLQDHARAGAADFITEIGRDPEWGRLFLEFVAHAARDDAFRVEMHARWEQMIARMAELIESYARDQELPIGDRAEPLARMISAMAHGAAMHQMLNPAASEELFGDMLELLTLGALAKAQR